MSEARTDAVLSKHCWVTTPDPELRPLAEPIAHWPITIILLSSPLGDYAAYVGIGSASWVARQGAKLTFEQARSFFPRIKADLYRE